MRHITPFQKIQKLHCVELTSSTAESLVFSFRPEEAGYSAVKFSDITVVYDCHRCLACQINLGF